MGFFVVEFTWKSPGNKVRDHPFPLQLNESQQQQ